MPYRSLTQRRVGFIAAGLLAIPAFGCLSEPAGPALNQIQGEPPPVTSDWVGRYTGAASGVFDQVVMDNVGVELVMTFDQPALPDCPACITVRVGDFFGQMNLRPQTSIAAEWSYELDGHRTTLRLEKFSASASPGSVFYGTLRVETQDPDPAAVETLTLFDFVVDRQ